MRYNIFTTNHMWYDVIGSNLNQALKLFFYQHLDYFFANLIIANNNLLFKICYENVVDISCK